MSDILALFSGGGGSVSTDIKTRAIGVALDYGAVIPTGIVPGGDIYCPFACTITAATLLSQSGAGSIVFDIWKAAYGAFPPTVANTIVAAAKPTLAAAQSSRDTTLVGWTTAIAAGDVLRFNVDSATTLTSVVLTLTVTLT